MGTLRKISPFETLISLADVFAGYGIISYYYMYGNLTRNSGIFFLLLASGLIFSARNIWDNFLREAEAKEQNNFRTDKHDTSSFLRGCLFCLLGLLVAMSRGMTTFIIAVILISLLIFKVFLLRRNDIFSAIFEGLIRGFNVILGMSCYPLLEATLSRPVPVIAAITVALYTCAVLLSVQKNLEFKSRLNLVFSVIAIAAVTYSSYRIMPHGLLSAIVASVATGFVFLCGLKTFFSRKSKNGTAFSRYGLAALILFEITWIASYCRGWEYQTRVISMGPLVLLFIISFMTAFYYARKPSTS